MGIITYTEEELTDAWKKIFIESPWLNGWECNGSICEDVFCCPGNPPDWSVLDTAKRILFLLGKDAHVYTISSNLEDYKNA